MDHDEMSPEQVHEYAKHLRGYATHFAPRDWNYTRDTGSLRQIRYDNGEDTLRGRIAQAAHWLVRKPSAWEADFGVSRWAMARHVLRRPDHLPDGVLDGGGVITFWEETGEYLQYVQPKVGALLADLIDAHPTLPEVQTVVREMARINEAYGERIERGETGYEEPTTDPRDA